MRRVLVFIIFWAGSSVFAQEISYSDASTEACSEEAVSDGERVACIGASARQCVEISGDERIMRALCMIEETKYWDRRLNAAYRWLRESYAERDAGRRTDNSTPYPRGLAMQEMQRAWIKYRDTRCRYEMAQWSGMPSAGLAEVECMLQATGEQALYLEAQPGDF